MKKGLFATMRILLAGLFVLYGCNGDDGGNQDADADAHPDIPGDRDVAPDLEVHPDPDATPDGEVQPEITPDITDITPDSTTCNPLLGGTCDLVHSCNCPSGQACRAVISAGDPCDTIIEQCSAAGTLATGTDCTQDSDCAAGNACLTSEVLGTKCFHWCGDDSDCESGHSCNIPIVFRGSDLGTGCADFAFPNGYRACDLGCPADAACDPITGSGCTAPTTSCVYEFTCKLLFCSTPGAHAIGEDCKDGAGCVIGSECLTQDEGATSWCGEFCNSTKTCPTGKTCSLFGYSGDATLGVCSPIH